MFYEKFSGFTSFAFIKRAICINTIFLILQQSVTKNVTRIVIPMVPNQRYNFPVTVFKGVSTYHTAIGAFQIISSCPTVKIVFYHFELFLLF